MNISIIIPTYNSEVYVRNFMNGMMGVIHQLEEHDFKFLFVDDGSSDKTVDILKSIKSEYANISILVFSRNFGQTNAILAGLKHSQADAYIVMSVDMQESPKLISDFIYHWNEGYKLCIAYRAYRSDNYIRKLFSKVFYSIIRIDKPSIPKGGFDFGLMDEDVAKALREKPLNYRFLQGDIVDLGYPTKYIPCERISSMPSSSKINFSVFKFNYFFDGIINVIRIPFKLIFLFSLLAVLFFTFNLFYQITSEFFIQQYFSLSNVIIHLQIWLLSVLMMLVCFLIEFSYRIYDIITKKKEYVIKEFLK